MLRTTNRYEGYAPVLDALAGQCVTLKHLRWPLPAESPENSTAGKRAGGGWPDVLARAKLIRFKT